MIIALTGGIGSGKTTIAKLFETMGCLIYYSDEKAKELYYHFEIKKRVIQLLGSDAYSASGSLNSTFIAGIIFKDKTKLESLNAIIHPALEKDFEIFVKQQSPDRIIIKESALIFETDSYKKFKTIILVTAPLEQKIKRVMQRNKMPRENVEKRMSAQWPDEQKIPLASYIIFNDDTEAVIPQVISVLKKIKS
ncbi:MAG: dephospho-CoA kinase [Bacteroidia bacterium]|nr:dephospho-CoA kinase [Bacteroidia bacterium]